MNIQQWFEMREDAEAKVAPAPQNTINHETVFALMKETLAKYGFEWDWSTVGPSQEDPFSPYAASFKIGPVTCRVRQDEDDYTMQLCFKGDGDWYRGNWFSYGSIKNPDNTYWGVMREAYQMALRDVKRGELAQDWLSRAPVIDSTVHQFVGKSSVITCKVGVANLSLRMSSETGLALNLELSASSDSVYDDVVEFLDCMVNQQPWARGSYTANSWSIGNGGCLVVTAPQSVEDDAPYVSVWWQAGIDYERLMDLFTDLLVHYKKLQLWAHQCQLQTDIMNPFYLLSDV